jgi:hypothetical protein
MVNNKVKLRSLGVFKRETVPPVASGVYKTLGKIQTEPPGWGIEWDGKSERT